MPGSSDDPERTDGIDDERTDANRYRLTNDLLAILLDLSFIVLIAAGASGVLNLTTVPVEVRLVYLTIVGAANVWAFGKRAFWKWRELRR